MANKLPKVTQVKIGKKLKFQVVEQPAGRKTFVSEEKDTLTAFKAPAKQGIYGFLAHNFLAGKHFLKLKPGSLIEISDQEGNDEWGRRFLIAEPQSKQNASYKTERFKKQLV